MTANRRILISLLAITWIFAGCGSDRSAAPADEFAPIRACVAASLTDVATAIGNQWSRETGQPPPVFNFAASGALAQQIVAAPRADVYLSASTRWMDFVERAGKIDPASRTTLVRNQLVVIAATGHRHEWTRPGEIGAIPFRLLSIGDPASVPAGRYAKEWLQSVPTRGGRSAWDEVEDRVAPAPDVRAALAQTLANRDLIGIVFRTDALTAEGKLEILYPVPVGDGPPIRYSGAVLANTRYPEAARDFLRYFHSEEGRRILMEAGFVAEGPPAPD